MSLSPELRLDRRTIQAATRGQQRARESVVKVLGPRLWALCRRLDPEPEDAYQAAWAHLFSRLDRFDVDGSASLSTWASTVTHRLLVDRHRRRQVRPFVPMGGLDEVDTSQDAEATVARALDRRRLEAALSRLPEGARRVVVLHYIHGLPLSEIAVSEGIAVGTCKSRLHRARTQLAQLLAPATPATARRAR